MPRYQFNKFIDSLEQCLDRWYYCRFQKNRDRQRIDYETMKLFFNDIDGWACMFFCKEDGEAMDQIDYETLEVTRDAQPEDAER